MKKPIIITYLPQAFQNAYNHYQSCGADAEFPSLFEQCGIEYPCKTILDNKKAFENYLIVAFLVQQKVNLMDIDGYYPISFLSDHADTMAGVIEMVMDECPDIKKEVFDTIHEEAMETLSKDVFLNAANATIQLNKDEVEVTLPEYSSIEVFLNYPFAQLILRNATSEAYIGSSASQLLSDIQNIKDPSKVSTDCIKAFAIRLNDLLQRYAENIVSEFFEDSYIPYVLSICYFDEYMVHNNGSNIIIGEDDILPVYVSEEVFSRLFA